MIKRIVPPVLILAFVCSFATQAAGTRSGTVRAYNEAKGFGFIRQDDGTDIYVTSAQLGGTSLCVGDDVMYEPGILVGSGPQAVNVSGGCETQRPSEPLVDAPAPAESSAAVAGQAASEGPEVPEADDAFLQEEEQEEESAELDEAAHEAADEESEDAADEEADEEADEATDDESEESDDSSMEDEGDESP